MANRSISISLDDRLLAQLDAQGSNRSALASEALTLRLARRQIQALEQAYAHPAQLEDGGGLRARLPLPWPWRRWAKWAMAERGRLHLWPRNRSFADRKPHPVLVIAPDAVTREGRRWVVLPLSRSPTPATALNSRRQATPACRPPFPQRAALRQRARRRIDRGGDPASHRRLDGPPAKDVPGPRLGAKPKES